MAACRSTEPKCVFLLLMMGAEVDTKDCVSRTVFLACSTSRNQLLLLSMFATGSLIPS